MLSRFSHSRSASSTASFDRLPNEVLFMIVAHMEGLELMNLRGTSKRLMNIVDEAVMSRPGLWKSSLFRDFPIPCVESVAPWCYSKKTVQEFDWKHVYASMHRVILKNHHELKYKHIVMDEDAVKAIADLKFHKNCLLAVEEESGKTCVVGIGELQQWSKIRDICMDGTSTRHRVQLSPDLNEKTWSQTMLLRYDHRLVPRRNRRMGDAADIHLNRSSWVHMSAWYPKQFPCDIYLMNSEKNKRNIIKLPSNPNPRPGVSNTDYLALGRGKALIAHSFMNYGSQTVQVTAVPLASEDEVRNTMQQRLVKGRGKVVKIQLLGDFALLLCEDGALLKCTLDFFSSDDVLNIEEEPMCVGGKFYARAYLDHMVNKVVDFVLLGQLFAAVTDRGKVYIRWMREPNAEFLDNSRFAPFSLPLHPNGHITRMALDITEGITVAALEKWTDGASWVSALHVVFVDKVC